MQSKTVFGAQIKGLTGLLFRGGGGGVHGRFCDII